jgi:hypothetical protein
MPRTFISKDALDREVLYVLMNHIGEPNAIYRTTLVSKIFDIGLYEKDQDDDTYDRQVRQSIERLRHQGHIICNTGNGVGYYVASTVEEYQAFRTVYGAHAFPIMEAIRRMDDAAKEKWPNPLQPRML